MAKRTHLWILLGTLVMPNLGWICSAAPVPSTLTNALDRINRWKQAHPSIAMQIDAKSASLEICETQLVASNRWLVVCAMKRPMVLNEIQFTGPNGTLVDYFPQADTTIAEADYATVQLAKLLDWREQWTVERAANLNCSIELTHETAPYSLRFVVKSRQDASELATVEYTFDENGEISHCCIVAMGISADGPVTFSSLDGATVSRQIDSHHVKRTIDEKMDLAAVIARCLDPKDPDKTDNPTVK